MEGGRKDTGRSIRSSTRRSTVVFTRFDGTHTVPS